MNNKFISYAIIVSLMISCISFLGLSLYSQSFAYLGLLVGTLWSCINLYFIKKSLEIILNSSTYDPLKFYTMIVIKFPFLYLMGYAILRSNAFDTLQLVLGFSVIFLAIFMLGIGTLFSSKLQDKIGSKLS